MALTMAFFSFSGGVSGASSFASFKAIAMRPISDGKFSAFFPTEARITDRGFCDDRLIDADLLASDLKFPIVVSFGCNTAI